LAWLQQELFQLKFNCYNLKMENLQEAHPSDDIDSLYSQEIIDALSESEISLSDSIIE